MFKTILHYNRRYFRFGITHRLRKSQFSFSGQSEVSCPKVEALSQKTAKLVLPSAALDRLTLHDNEDDEQRFVIGPIHDICQRHKFLGLSQLAV